MKTTILTSFMAAALLTGTPALVLSADPMPPMKTTEGAAADARFIETATQGNWAESKNGELAKDRTKRLEVKALATAMVDDHNMAQRNLKEIADNVHVKIPTDINAEQQTTFDLLKAANDLDFDRRYVDTVIANHQKAIALYEVFAITTTHPSLKSYAQSNLPHLKAHLQKAEELGKSLGAIVAK